MAQRGNPKVRFLLTLLIVLVVGGVSWAFFLSSSNKPTPSPTTPQQPEPRAAAPAERPAPTPEPSQSPAPEQVVAAPAPDAPPSGRPAALEGLRARNTGAMEPQTLGLLDAQAPIRQALTIDPLGVGVGSLKLGRYFTTIKNEANVEVQRTHREGAYALTPFSALGVQVEGVIVNLLSASVWSPVPGAPSGTFEAIVENASGEAVLRIVRSFRLTSDSYEIELAQTVENLTDRELNIRWFQYGPVDLENDSAGGSTKVSKARDMRRLRFGYLLKAQSDPSQRIVFANAFLWFRPKVLGKADKATGLFPDVATVWPNPVSLDAEFTLAWAGMSNRYFSVVTHGLVGDAPNPASFSWVDRIDRVVLHRYIEEKGQPVYAPVIGVKLDSKPVAVAPGSTADFSMGIYAGPMEKDAITADPRAAAAGVQEIVVYNAGGPCAFCTFPVLTDALVWLLEIVHRATADWAVAIIILVIIVRTVLHPVNRWSQVRMQRFAKQMQDIAPKQKKLQERYANDKQKLQQETGKLWREEGINPAGMLGCLPMLMQTPIWIALYATLYYAFELRQQPAFYGIFQSLTGGGWAFMADLAEPDHAIWFAGKGIHIWFLSDFMGPITGLNVLPLAWGAVFWVHQKYLTPPTTGTMTPEQEQQQKIIKVMSVVMLPVFMYNAPSGLLVYFLTNSVLAIVENHWIREHVKKHDLLNPEKYRKQKKGPGFMQRLQMLAEQKQAQQQSKGAKGSQGFNPGARGPQRPPRR
ncbi:MAG: membrane protein insertase YidC [Phycisphaeraceae bacterium]|nr:MAG: membrane protein insertase YidC [Phycisphaeraceae bacterium]